METQIKYNGSSPILKVLLKHGEILKAQTDSLIVASADVKIDAVCDGDSKESKRRIMAGESLNLQQFYAENGDCSLILGPGDDAPVASLVELEVEEDNEICIYKGSYFAGTRDVVIDIQKVESVSKVENLSIKGRNGRDEGNIIGKLSGNGIVYLYGYGSIEQITLDIDEEVIVDSNNILAWPSDMEVYIDCASDDKKEDQDIGETQIYRMIGPGKILIQTGKRIL